MSGPTIHSERHDAPLHLGKASATAPRFVSYATELRPKLKAKGLLPTVPQMFGHGHDFPQGKWLMLGNGPALAGEKPVPSTWEAFLQAGGAGDCAIAEPCHDEMEAARNAGRPIPPFSIETAIKQYGELSGYDPVTGANDNGLNIQDVIEHRQKVGLYDDNGVRYKIGQAANLTPGNVSELWECAWLFENVDLGVVLSEAQETQFNERAQPTWEYVSGSPEIGGHAVPVVGKLGLLSWAEDVYWGVPFIQHQMDEGVCYVDNERYNQRTGETAEGFDEQDLEKFIVLEAQAKMAVVA